MGTKFGNACVVVKGARLDFVCILFGCWRCPGACAFQLTNGAKVFGFQCVSEGGDEHSDEVRLFCISSGRFKDILCREPAYVNHIPL